ncbi:MAG TPA: hypothetical protein VHI52_02965 [Verrucomicrobiae bacterium]|nr:hypothetical protein [Verrucomicrobiae bacterium]
MKKHVSKDQWVSMFEDLGWDGTKRMQWHKLFEARHPDGHQGFLEWLGIPTKEIDRIRAQCR